MDSLILEISTRGLHRYEPIEAEITTLGRALDNDIILSDPTVAPHHLKVIRHQDGRLELINLAAVNPTRVETLPIDTRELTRLPVGIEIGRVQLQLLTRENPVAETQPLAGNGRHGHLFGHPYWAILLALTCICVDALDFYLNSYNSFKWSDLLKFVLRETMLTIGAFVLALSILERLLVNRWEMKQMLTSVCLVYLLFAGATVIVDGLDYLLSASWPSTLFQFGWYLAIIPVAIAIYLIHISHIKRERSIVLALLIASSIAVPSILQSPELQSLLDNFSSSASYHNRLSYLNWQLRDSVSIDRFIEQANELESGEFAD
ncbi:MAG: FHA domain-containing protein [Gammaproteobacteria bacterium]|nr:FHA domain-containing protein [Gammaproteobacteria bacterium]